MSGWAMQLAGVTPR